MKIPRSPRQPLVGLFLFATAGIAASEYSPGKTAVPVALALFGASAAFAVWRRTTAGVLLCTACAFFLLHRPSREDSAGRALAPVFEGKPLVKATGIIISEPQIKQNARGGLSSEFRLQLESIEMENSTVRESAVVQARWAGDSPAYGDRVAITGGAENIAPPRNPGQFDYAGYMHRLGIYTEISMLDATSGEVLDGGHGNPVVALALKTRHWVQQKLQLGLEDSPNVSGLIQSLTLGLKNETPEETRELFQRTGTLHLFVVNGLHVGMFTAIMFLLVRMCGAGRRLSIAIVIPLIFFYALLTGSSTGSIRASIMAAVLLGGLLVDGKPVMLNNLAAAGLVILAWNTNELFMPGFQFSFGVVFTIILMAGWLQRRLEGFGRPDEFLPRSLWNLRQKAAYFCARHTSQMLAVSTAAGIGAVPFSAAYFNLFTPASVIANMVVVPIAFLILAYGILSAIGGAFSGWLSVLYNNVNWVLAHAILWVVQLFAQVPLGHRYVEIPRPGAKPLCEITVLDLGDGGAVHVRSAGRDWLVDCGNASPYETIVKNYLHSRGVNRLDGFVVSHGNSKFIGAAVAVENDFAPAESLDSPLDDRSPARRVFHDWLAGQARARTTLKRGDEFNISPNAKIRVLYPPPDSPARLADDKALVLQLECAGCRVLFMNGAGSIAEQWLVNNETDLRCDILVRSPHAGETFDLIDAARPKAIICSCSTYVAAGRIDEDWATGVATRGIRLFREDETGAVTVGLDPGKFTLAAFMGGQTFSGPGGQAK